MPSSDYARLSSDTDTQGLPADSEGFICPICMEGLRSAEALQVHWNAAHSDDKKKTEEEKSGPLIVLDGASASTPPIKR